MSGVELSLIIPAYNSAAFIADTLARATAYLEGRREKYELIVVDDGSSDGSAPLLKGLSADRCSFRFFPNPANRGNGHAVRPAALHSSGPRAIFPTTDPSYPLA